MNLDSKPISEIQDYFLKSCQELGQSERIRNLYKIRPKLPGTDKKGRRQFFVPNRMQEDFLNKQSHRDAILKMRQGGATTISEIKGIDSVIFGDNFHCAIMAHQKENAQKFFSEIKDTFEDFQRDWGALLPRTTKKDNVNELFINETNSYFVVCTETKGLALDYLHVSEAAFIPDQRISESIESVPLTGQVILESTPDTASGLFYNIWESFLAGKPSSYKCHFYPWWWRYPEDADLPLLICDGPFLPTPDEEVLMNNHQLTQEHILWRRLKISESGGDVGEFSRKYPEDALTCFLSGSSSVFPANTITRLLKNARDPIDIGSLSMAA